MFNFFFILLLLIAVLQIVEALQLWVKPSKLRYDAEIICLNSNGLPLKVEWAKHMPSLDESGRTGYVVIYIDLGRCDQRNSKVKVLIKNLDYPFKSMEFDIPKTELSAQRSDYVLGFNIEPEHKQFYFEQSAANFGVSQRPLVDYELKIECEYQPPRSIGQYIVFGSGVQFNGQNGIKMPIYEIEMLEFCTRRRIGLVIYNAKREKTSIGVTTKFLLDNNAFNINMSNKTVQPILQRRT